MRIADKDNLWCKIFVAIVMFVHLVCALCKLSPPYIPFVLLTFYISNLSRKGLGLLI